MHDGCHHISYSGIYHDQKDVFYRKLFDFTPLMEMQFLEQSSFPVLEGEEAIAALKDYIQQLHHGSSLELTRSNDSL